MRAWAWRTARECRTWGGCTPRAWCGCVCRSECGASCRCRYRYLSGRGWGTRRQCESTSLLGFCKAFELFPFFPVLASLCGFQNESVDIPAFQAFRTNGERLPLGPSIERRDLETLLWWYKHRCRQIIVFLHRVFPRNAFDEVFIAVLLLLLSFSPRTVIIITISPITKPRVLK